MYVSTSERQPFSDGTPASVEIKSILYGNSFQSLTRSINSIRNAAEFAVREKLCSSVGLSYGDNSPTAMLDDGAVSELQGQMPFTYRHFGDNLGSAGGHNALSLDSEADFLLIVNPDIVLSPRAIIDLLVPFRYAGVGMTEAKQIPIEHPKDYNRDTGETSWAATACAMVPRALFQEMEGFDAETFFLYCDDVDFSWRVREKGLRVMFRPTVPVFHDKRLSRDAGWIASQAERYYSAEAALLLAHKWSRPDLVDKHIQDFVRSNIAELHRAAAEFRKREKEGRLPEPRDAEHAVGQFVDDRYAVHRFSL